MNAQGVLLCVAAVMFIAGVVMVTIGAIADEKAYRKMINAYLRRKGWARPNQSPPEDRSWAS